ncbi:hypothetical protein [Brevundimonas sp. NIBR11]|uniref:hypothetical protein n=1 Tax=Brevundimonas sp. NIBR11 TaxID=3015999 RepID=UPI0022F0FB1A|nr:hypothetical protein [Brevundimonas sp. NIBR11]
MSFARPHRFGPKDRRRAALLAGSILFHLAVITPMAIGLLGGDRPVFVEDPEPPIFVEMEPRPLLQGEIAREPAPASLAAREQSPALDEALPTVARPDTRREEDEEDRPTPPVPRIGSSPLVDPPPASADPWQVRPEGMAAAVGRSMRTGAGGCRMMDGRLSASEQRLCDDRFNAAAGAAGPLGPRTLTPSEQRREAQFAQDGAAALAAHDSLRGGRAGPGITLASPDCPGGNLRGSCAGAHLRPGFEMTDERLRNNRKME